MKSDQIQLHQFYVDKGESLVREILKDASGNVTWLSYRLRDGSSDGDYSTCTKTALANWAGREATPVEIERMDTEGAHRKADERYKRKAETIVQQGLEMAEDEELLAEVHRRGLNLE